MKEFHPVANLFPMMDEDSFKALCDDIKVNGLIEPIWLHEGKIIDGRNRYKACLETGVPPVFRNWKNDGSLVAFVVSLNLNRRHLNQSQKAAIALDILPMLEAEAKERQRKAGKEHGRGMGKVTTELKEAIPHTEAAAQAAELVGASATRVYEMKKVAREAPERVAAIRNGEVSIDKVLKEIKPKKEVLPQEDYKPRKECTEAMQFAVIAISQLTRIREDDPQKVAALKRVADYINEQLQGV